MVHSFKLGDIRVLGANASISIDWNTLNISLDNWCWRQAVRHPAVSVVLLLGMQVQGIVQVQGMQLLGEVRIDLAVVHNRRCYGRTQDVLCSLRV